ncbi:SpaH/EbpB family LPXTG-anchored major pilin [Bhargavaea ullalensis]|uniref:Fimbrial isopeptide formation D2 family protein/LPXTG-motif cell wall-anchored protein n=1 Tax=Bhargavaea ullalensis TaxID=1265685 RepID=A0ABV2GEG9_9BACL
MALAKNKWGSLLFAFALIAAMFVPQMAFATGGPDKTGSLTIHKFAQEPGSEAGEEGTGLPGQGADGTPVAGVKYSLIQTHSYDPATGIWKPASVEAIKFVTTGEGGSVTVSNIKLGRYEVKEVSGPDHILLNPEPFFVDIPMTNKEGTSLNYDVHVYPKNEIVRSAVELTKVGEDGSPLAGVTFKLFKADGSPAKDKDGQDIPSMTTLADGKVSISGLGAGEYYFQETAVPAGYALNNTKVKFKIERSGQDIVVNWTNEEGFANNGTVTNYITPEIEKDANGESHLNIDRGQLFDYNLTITAPKDIHKYASITVTDKLDSRLEYGGQWSVKGTEQSNIDFSQDGQLLKWTVKNPSALTPGEEIKITFNAKIRPDAELKGDESGIPNTADLKFNNGRGYEDTVHPGTPPTVTPTSGGLKIIKVDAADNSIKLPGAEFKLTDLAGNVIDTTNMGNVVHLNGSKFNGKLENLKTRDDGTIEIKGLTPGEYLLHETKAPTYTEDGVEKSYRLLTKAIDVKVQNGKDAEVTVKNSKSGWLLPTTGGIGTILFTSGGLALMGLATGMYVRRRKTDSGTA